MPMHTEKSKNVHNERTTAPQPEPSPSRKPDFEQLTAKWSWVEFYKQHGKAATLKMMVSALPQIRSADSATREQALARQAPSELQLPIGQFWGTRRRA